MMYCSVTNIQGYNAIVDSLKPESVQQHATKFPEALQLCDGFLSASIVLQFCLIVYGTYQWSRYNASKWALKWAWILMYATPFVLMMVFPYRLTLDWDAASISVCEDTLQKMSDSGALQLFRISTDDVIRSQISPELLKANPSPQTYCAEYGKTWTLQIGTDLSVLQCEFQDPPEDACCIVRFGSLGIDENQQQCTEAQQTVVDDDVSSTNIALYSYLKNLEMVTSTTTSALDNSKYVVGMLMGVYAMKILLPPVFGLINGLASALIHVKVQMPKIIAIAYVILITTVMVVPLLAAFLAAIFQMVGTWALIPSNLFTLTGAGIFALPCASAWLFETWSTFGYGSEGVVVASEGVVVSKIKSKIRRTLALQMLCYVLAVVFMIIFIYSADMMSYLNSDLIVSFIPQGLTVLIGIFVNTRLSRLTVSDAILLMLNNELEVHEEQSKFLGTGSSKPRDSEANPAFRNSENDMKSHLKRASIAARGNNSFDAQEKIHALADVQRLHALDYDRSREALPHLVSFENTTDFFNGVYRVLMNYFLYVKEAICPPRFGSDGVGSDSGSSGNLSEVKQGVFVAKVLYWRFSALNWLVFYITFAIGFGGYSLSSKYQDQFYEGVIIQIFPAELTKFGAKFALGLYAVDAALLVVLVVPAFVVVRGYSSWRNFKRSTYQLRIAWILFYLIPFMIMLAWPYRSLVPYDDASKELCKVTFKQLEADGTLGTMKTVGAQLDVKTVGDGTLESGLIESGCCTTYEFCVQHGAEWINVMNNEFDVSKENSIAHQINHNFDSQPSETSLADVLEACDTQKPLEIVGMTNATSTVGIPTVGSCSEQRGKAGVYEKLCGSCVSEGTGENYTAPMVGRFLYDNSLCSGDAVFSVEDEFICDAEANKLALRTQSAMCTGTEDNPAAATREQCDAIDAGDRECIWVYTPTQKKETCQLEFQCSDFTGNRNRCLTVRCLWDEETKVCATSTSAFLDSDALVELQEQQDLCATRTDQTDCLGDEECTWRFNKCTIDISCAEFDLADDCAAFGCTWQRFPPKGQPNCQAYPAGAVEFDLKLLAEKPVGDLSEAERKALMDAIRASSGSGMTGSFTTGTGGGARRSRHLLEQHEIILHIKIAVTTLIQVGELVKEIKNGIWMTNFWKVFSTDKNMKILSSLGLSKATGKEDFSINPDTTKIISVASIEEANNFTNSIGGGNACDGEMTTSTGECGSTGGVSTGGTGGDGDGEKTCVCKQEGANYFVAICKNEDGAYTKLPGTKTECENCWIGERPPLCAKDKDKLSPRGVELCEQECPASVRRLSSRQLGLMALADRLVQPKPERHLEDELSAAQVTALVETLDLVRISVAQSETLIHSFEYVLGTIMGAYAVKLLLPAALGLITGLITGFNNVKHLLPQSSMLGNMAVICAAVVTPLFAAFLAAIFQVVGDKRFLSPGIICLCVGVGMPVVFYKGLMNHNTSSVGIHRTLALMFYAQYSCYIMGGLFISLYIYTDETLKQYLSNDTIKALLDPLTLACVLFRLFASCTLSKLATTDLAVSLAVHEFKDLTQMSDDSKRKFVELLTGMRLLRGENPLGCHADKPKRVSGGGKPSRGATESSTANPLGGMSAEMTESSSENGLDQAVL
jgi:hypothetical protein